MTAPFRSPRRHNTVWSTALVLCCAIMAPVGSQSRVNAQALPSATSPDGKVRLEILSLKRTEGDTVTLRFQIVNESNDRFFVTIPNMRLIDIAGRRVYGPGIMSGSCATTKHEDVDCAVLRKRGSDYRCADQRLAMLRLLVASVALAVMAAPVQASPYPIGGITFPIGPLTFPSGAVSFPSAPIQTETATTIEVTLPADILFDFDKANIRPDAQKPLHEIAELVRQKAHGPVVIQGYTDALGGDSYN
jgi:hypothetical protein